jgi:hypothetical protein
VPSAHGALLGVQKGYPDFTSVSSTDINNVFDSPNNRYVMTINGSAGTQLVGQTVQWFSGDVDHRVCPTNTVGSSCTATPYTLTAYFNTSGVFTGGNIAIDGYIDLDASTVANGYTVNPALPNTGSLLDATLTAFGFLGTAATTGTGSYDGLLLDFRFTLDNTSSDFNQMFGTAGGGAIWNGRVQTGQVDRAWVQTDFAHAFSCTGATGCNATMDTFVPLPSAVWLFGSGLISLFGVGARLRKSHAV